MMQLNKYFICEMICWDVWFFWMMSWKVKGEKNTVIQLVKVSTWHQAIILTDIGTQLPGLLFSHCLRISLRRPSSLKTEISRMEKHPPKIECTNSGMWWFCNLERSHFQLHDINREAENTKKGWETSDCSMLVWSFTFLLILRCS